LKSTQGMQVFHRRHDRSDGRNRSIHFLRNVDRWQEGIQGCQCLSKILFWYDRYDGKRRKVQSRIVRREFGGGLLVVSLPFQSRQGGHVIGFGLQERASLLNKFKSYLSVRSVVIRLKFNPREKICVK
jgi:hypothetical protein